MVRGPIPCPCRKLGTGLHTWIATTLARQASTSEIMLPHPLPPTDPFPPPYRWLARGLTDSPRHPTVLSRAPLPQPWRPVAHLLIRRIHVVRGLGCHEEGLAELVVVIATLAPHHHPHRHSRDNGGQISDVPRDLETMRKGRAARRGYRVTSVCTEWQRRRRQKQGAAAVTTRRAPSSRAVPLVAISTSPPPGSK